MLRANWCRAEGGNDPLADTSKATPTHPCPSPLSHEYPASPPPPPLSNIPPSKPQSRLKVRFVGLPRWERWCVCNLMALLWCACQEKETHKHTTEKTIPSMLRSGWEGGRDKRGKREGRQKFMRKWVKLKCTYFQWSGNNFCDGVEPVIISTLRQQKQWIFNRWSSRGTEPRPTLVTSCNLPE